jgi:hypothetical protein
MRLQPITFAYKDIGSGSLRPMIPIEIHKRMKSVRVEVLVDSGADFSIMWADIGEALGIDVKAGDKYTFGGIGTKSGQPQTGYGHRVGITIGKETINTYMVFSYDIPEGIAIVGQTGFFDRFSITFDRQKKELSLLRNPPRRKQIHATRTQ